MTARAQISDTVKFLAYLHDDCGYLDIQLIDENRYAAIMPLLFTHAIIVGRIGDRVGYDDRWCYGGYPKAKAALEAWDFTGEPEGWHRHPNTGRRREYDEEMSRLMGEYVAP